MPSAAETLTNNLAGAWRGRTLIAMEQQPVPADLGEALAVQAGVARALHRQQAGWKVAIAADGTPISGIMPGPWLKPDDTYEGVIGAELRLEIELALRLSRDLPLRPGQPYTRAEILDGVDAVFLGIEIVETRLSTFHGVPFPLWLADSLGHGGYLIGPEVDRAVLDDVTSLHCHIALNDVTIYDLPAVHGNGDPMNPVLAWVNRAAEGPGPLKAGQIVTTGSLCGGVLAPGKGRAVCSLKPIGEIALTLR